jgi:hypothetical protein
MENFFASSVSERGKYPEYIRNFYNSIKKTEKDVDRHFTKEDLQITSTHKKR